MDRVVILGCGRQGARLAQLLEAEQYDVRIIDKSPEAFRRLESFKGQRILGNGIDVDVLKRAGIEGAAAFAAVTNGDNTNLMAAQITKEIFQIPKVLCRVYDPRRAGIYHEMGLDTVCATTVGARMLRNVITAPKVLRLYQMGDGTTTALEIKMGEEARNKTLKELEIPGEFRIAGVTRDHAPLVPTDAFRFQPGDQIFGVVVTQSMDKLRHLFHVEQTAVNFPLKGGY